MNTSQLENEIDVARKQFAIAADHARGALNSGRFLNAAVWSQIAAHCAFRHHPGFFASSDLEGVLTEIASSCDSAKKDDVPIQRSGKPHILHVMSEAYATGGHTRVVERWINNCRDSATHSLICTYHHNRLPHWLAEAVEKSGGWHKTLATTGSNIIDRALQLRAISRTWADVVILHIHMHDVIPIVAYGIDGGPPVMLFNHADHLFWLGSSIADVVLDIRKIGRHLSLRKRGVVVSKILPIPIQDNGRSTDKAGTRAKLGIPPESVVLLTIGDAHKFTPLGDYDFLGTFLPFVGSDKNVILLAVGPKEDARWTSARIGTDGRIRALGRIADLSLFYDSADIYLDPFPVSSFTAMLDAASRGIPCVGLINSDAPILSNIDALGRSPIIQSDTIDSYLNSIRKLVHDPKMRALMGADNAEEVRKHHTPPGWTKHVDEIMNRIPTEHKVRRLTILDDAYDANDLILANVHSRTNAHYGLGNAISRNCRYFDLAERAALLYKAKLGRHNNVADIPFKALLSEDCWNKYIQLKLYCQGKQ